MARIPGAISAAMGLLKVKSQLRRRGRRRKRNVGNGRFGRRLRRLRRSKKAFRAAMLGLLIAIVLAFSFGPGIVRSDEKSAREIKEMLCSLDRANC